MDSGMWVAAVLFIIILALLLYLDTRKPPNFPPGPPWLPVLGSTLEIVRMRKKTGFLAAATAELARRYNSALVGLRVGKDLQVILCSYESLREVLNREEFDGRPKGLFYETRTWGVRRGVLLTDETFWQEQRRFVLRHLRDLGFGRRTMSQLIEEESAQLLAGFRERVMASPGGAVVAMNDTFGVAVLNTLWMMLAGIRYSPDDIELKKLQTLLTDLFANIDMSGCLFSHFPMLRFIAPELSGYKQFMTIHQKVWHFLKNELEKHKSTLRPDYARDFMDVYLQMLNSKDRKDSFSESQLMAICMDLFMAGSETTTKTLGFGFFYLLLNPEVQRRAQAEMDAVVGRDRLPLLSDRPNLPYVEALSLESLRMFMGRAFGVPHRTLKDTELQGYHIPKDTMILCNFHVTLMDKKIWGDPEAFRPDRFLDAEGKLSVPEQFTPFGLGKHRCMGENMAKANVFLFMATLLQNFNFSLPPHTKQPSTEHIDGVTPSPKPFEALITLRS